jgi:hypothetical protein
MGSYSTLLPNFLNSTNVITLHLNSATRFTPGGTTGMEIRNIFGPEITWTEFTPVSAESVGIVPTIH